MFLYITMENSPQQAIWGTPDVTSCILHPLRLNRERSICKSTFTTNTMFSCQIWQQIFRHSAGLLRWNPFNEIRNWSKHPDWTLFQGCPLRGDIDFGLHVGVVFFHWVVDALAWWAVGKEWLEQNHQQDLQACPQPLEGICCSVVQWMLVVSLQSENVTYCLQLC